MYLDELLTHLDKVKKNGGEYRANCPVHGGHSLDLTEKDGRILLICRGGGCTARNIMESLGLKIADLFHNKREPYTQFAQPVKVHQNRHTPDNKARKSLNWGVPADPDHPYLKRKQIPPMVARQLGSTLGVPMWNEGGLIVGMQSIYTNGTKKFMKGVAAKGLFCFLKPKRKSDIVWLAEGYATAATVALVTKEPTVCAFSAANMPAVVDMLLQRTKYRIYIAADNDPHGVGVKYAKECLELGADWWSAPDEVCDWNDYYIAAKDNKAMRTEEALYCA